MPQVQFVPSQDRWANLGTQIGQQIGSAFNNQIQQNTANAAVQKALGIIGNQYNQQVSPNYSQQQLSDAASQYSGIKNLTGMNAIQGIANAQNTWQTANDQLYGINDQLANTTDAATQKVLNDQKATLTNQMNVAHQQADFLRGLLTSKGADMTGLGANDNASDLLSKNKDFYTGLLPQTAVSSNQNNAASTDDGSLLGQNWKDSFGMNNANQPASSSGLDSFSTLNTVPNQNQDAAKNIMLANSVAGAAKNDNSNYTITAADLANNPNIASFAKQLAYATSRNSWNPTVYSTALMQELIKNGIDPKTMGEMQPLIDKQANEIGNRYLGDYLQNNNGDARAAAQYAVSHGMPNLLPTAQMFANKYTTDKTDTGKNINYTNIGTGNFGGSPVYVSGPSLAKTTTPGEDLSASLSREKLAETGREFNQTMAQKDRQFYATLQQGNDRLALMKDGQEKQNLIAKMQTIAGMANNTRSEIQGYRDQIQSIIKGANGGDLSADEKSAILSLNQKIDNASQQYSAYNSALSSISGISVPSYQQQSNDPVDQKIDQARAAGWPSDQIKDYLDKNGLGAYKSHVW